MGEPPVPLIDVGGFHSVDESAEPRDFAVWMAHQRRRGADGAIAKLALVSDSSVLDLGCGTGVDLRQLTELTGRCVGIDRSLAMTLATQANTDGRAHAVCGDGAALPFAADSFDACWSRAVLVHTPRPNAVVAEVARVLRPGGRAVLSEPDHGTHVVNTPQIDVFERVLHHRRSTFQSPLVGRRLPELLAAAGLRVEQVSSTPIVHTSLNSARASGGPFDLAVQAAIAGGAITADEGDSYLHSLEVLDEAGSFLFSAMAFTAVAVADPPA